MKTGKITLWVLRIGYFFLFALAAIFACFYATEPTYEYGICLLLVESAISIINVVAVSYSSSIKRGRERYTKKSLIKDLLVFTGAVVIASIIWLIVGSFFPKNDHVVCDAFCYATSGIAFCATTFQNAGEKC